MRKIGRKMKLHIKGTDAKEYWAHLLFLLNCFYLPYYSVDVFWFNNIKQSCNLATLINTVQWIIKLGNVHGCRIFLNFFLSHPESCDCEQL